MPSAGGRDQERQPFYCPYPGCKRKFASLWRLKVHYRAPPNERGSGKERGHGVELPICPACNEQLEPGKHHNKCKAGRTTNPPSKRAPKATAAGNRSTKSTRQVVVSKRVARESSGVDATCTQRAEDQADNCKDATLATPLRCIPQSRASDMDVAQGTFMMSQLFSCHAQQGGSATAPQAVHVYPTLEYNYAPSAEDDVLHDSGPSSHEVGQAHADEAHADTFAMPLSAAQQLSAQGAAKVLYTIARSDAEPMGANGSDTVALATAYPHYALSPLSGASRGNDDEADDAMHNGGARMDSDLLHSPDSAGGLASEPIAHSVLVPGQTAEGVPVESLNTSMPMLYPWSDGQGQSGIQLVMSPQGLVPANVRSQFFIPVQTIKGPGGEEMTVVMPQDACCMSNGYNMVVAPDSTVGAPVVLSADGVPQYAADGQHMCMPVLQVPEGRPVCNVAAMQAMGAPLYGNGGISEEDFLRAIRMASATEVSATS